MSIEAVLFDWGHTLFDTPGSADFIVAFAVGAGIDLIHADAYLLWNEARLRSRTAHEMAKGRDTSAALHRSCWFALYADLERRCPGISEALYSHETSASGWSPYADVEGVLLALAERGIPVVIVSDVAFDLRPILAHYGLDHFIHEFVLSGEHGTIKPELRLFDIALNAAGVSADHALMVGDNHLNDGAAIDVGIRTLLLPPVGHGVARGLHVVVDLVDASR